MNWSEKMTTDSNQNTLSVPAEGRLCFQAGILPAPSRSVPTENPTQLEIYLDNGDSYLLYSAVDLHFGPKNLRCLPETGIEFVYISVQNQRPYYRTIENLIQKIVDEPKLPKNKKDKILYLKD